MTRSIKRTFVYSFILAMLGVSLFAVNNKTTYACTCAPFDSLESELDVTDVVFDGVLLSLQEVKSDTALYLRKKASFQVNGGWKGEPSSQLDVYTAEHNEACGFEFKVGERYVVFAGEDENGKLRTSICSSTSKLTDESALLDQLGAYTYVNENKASEVPSSSTVWSNTSELLSPDSIEQIATEEEVRQSISDRKSSIAMVFAVVGGAFLITAVIIISVLIRRRRG